MQQLLQGILKKLLPFLFLLPASLLARPDMDIITYIETYRYIAMAEMRQSGIPASIKLAQAILESGFGNSELAVQANNHFGIKCHDWSGLTYYYDDDKPGECFRVYTDPVQSFLDHTDFLTTRPRYAFLFELPPGDYRAWAQGLSRAGYATNPRYPERLIRIIQEHRLDQYDKKAMDPSFVIDEYRLLAGPARATASFPGKEPDLRIEGRHRETGQFNRIDYVLARKGDTPRSLAAELDMRPWQIIRYNQLEEGQAIGEGERIFLQPKRRRGPVPYHIANEEDTMAGISQQYGIRLENLYRRNAMTKGMEPRPGQRILLQGYEGSLFDYLLRRP